MEKALPEPVARYVWVDSERMGGEPCFRDSRVPLRNLFDYLAGGHTLDEFLDDFEGVTREQALGVIELAASGLIGPLEIARAA